MTEPKVVASRYANSVDRRRLWQAAIKWPMYAVAVMPVLLAAGWSVSKGLPLRLDQLLLFLLAAVLLLAWENLANDVFDSDTGVDADGKPQSVVNLTGRRDRVAGLANGCLLLGLCRKPGSMITRVPLTSPQRPLSGARKGAQRNTPSLPLDQS